MSKKKLNDRYFNIFRVLLTKLGKHPMNIQEQEIIKLYKRAIEITETVNKLEYIYNSKGELEDVFKNFEEWNTW